LTVLFIKIPATVKKWLSNYVVFVHQLKDICQKGLRPLSTKLQESCD